MSQTTQYGTLDPRVGVSLFDRQEEAIKRTMNILRGFADVPPDDGGKSDLPNHVIALLGSRGAGKTTTLVNLIDRIKLDQEFDRWLCCDLFRPDLLHSETAVAPAAMSLIYEAIKRASEDKSDEVKRDIELQFEALAKGLGWLFADQAPMEMIMRDAISVGDFGSQLFGHFNAVQSAPERFRNWVEDSLHAVGVDYLLFPVDDADLAPNLVTTITDFIRYYLSTKRVIAVLCADEPTIRRRIFNARLKEMPVIKALPEAQGFSLFGTSGLDYKQAEIEAEFDYVDSYLTKIMPPSTRVYVADVDHDALLDHEFEVGVGDRRSVFDLLNTLELKHGSRRTRLSELVRRYPGVLANNLRSFINQFNLLFEALGKRRDAPEEAPAAGAKEDRGGILKVEFDNSKEEMALLVRVIGVFLQSSAHRAWRDVLMQYEQIDILTERDPSVIVNVILQRVRLTGLVANHNRYQFTGNIDRAGVAETDIFDFLVDLCVAGGTPFGAVAREVSFYPDS